MIPVPDRIKDPLVAKFSAIISSGKVNEQLLDTQTAVHLAQDIISNRTIKRENFPTVNIYQYEDMSWKNFGINTVHDCFCLLEQFDRQVDVLILNKNNISKMNRGCAFDATTEEEATLRKEKYGVNFVGHSFMADCYEDDNLADDEVVIASVFPCPVERKGFFQITKNKREKE